MAKKSKKVEEEKIPTLAEFEAKKVVPVPEVRNVKVKALREFEIPVGKGFKMVKAGEVVLLSEDEAKEFCDKVFAGYIPAYGYMPEIGPLLEGQPNPLERKQIVRAERVA